MPGYNPPTFQSFQWIQTRGGSYSNIAFPKSDIGAEDLGIFVYPAPQNPKAVKISFYMKQNAVNLSPLHCSDIFLSIAITSKNAVKIVEDKSLRFLIDNHLAVVKVNACQIEATIPLDNDFVDYSGELQVRLLGRMVGEVMKINPNKDQFEDDGLDVSTANGFKVLDQNGTNITRTGKSTDDLDESDMRCIANETIAPSNKTEVRMYSKLIIYDNITWPNNLLCFFISYNNKRMGPFQWRFISAEIF